jgi:hypothetical protein
MLEAVTLREIERIFAVTDAMGIHREALVIPLMPRPTGRVRRLPGGKIEIVVAAADFEGWLAGLGEEIRCAAPPPSGGSKAEPRS